MSRWDGGGSEVPPNQNTDFEESLEELQSNTRPKKLDTCDKNNRSSRVLGMWRVWGKRVPSSEIVFVCQMTVIFVVVICSIYNLTVDSSRTELWTALLSSSLGYILPSPRLREH